MKIVFFLPSRDILDQIAHTPPSAHPELYNTGVKVWIGQTYHRLKHMGVAVELSAQMPTHGLVITHADHAQEARRTLRPWHSVVLVSTRADRSPSRWADIEIVQNAHAVRGPRQRHMPHWPQPGIQARDPGRGSRIENVIYKGAAPELHPRLAIPAWADEVSSLGMTWKADAAVWVSNGQRVYTGIDWTDYTQADVIVALRHDAGHGYPTKPASKLINAWHAGVPALLGPEVAYQELRRSPLDYIEVKSPADVLDALRRLQANPSLYQDMVAHSQTRARDFTPTALDAQWHRTLSELAQVRPTWLGRGIRHLLAQRGVPLPA